MGKLVRLENLSFSKSLRWESSRTQSLDRSYALNQWRAGRGSDLRSLVITAARQSS
jgi:hypothetical protein